MYLQRLGLFLCCCSICCVTSLSTSVLKAEQSKTNHSSKISISNTNTAKNERLISGIVKDEKDQPLVGVNIVIKGTLKGTTTDMNGKYSLKVSSNNTLKFVYIGFVTQEIHVGNKKHINVVLHEDQTKLESAVVTALGIKRSEKALTYNVQRVKGNEITAVPEVNFVNALNGKVAGVVINTSSAGVGGAARVVMRGPKSINYNNNALYVIDGVPMINDGGVVSGMYNSNTTSDNASTINPDDIQSISVLTGAAASALYGSLGQNGVILITTKSGVAGKPKLTYSNATSFLSPFILPHFQNTYGTTDLGSFDSWGEKLAKPSSYSPKNFFQTGLTESNSITFTSGTKTNRSFISLASLNARGIIPSNTLNRYNVMFKNSISLFKDKLNITTYTMFMHQKERNLFAQGLYNNPIVPVYLFPPGGNWNAIKAFERFDGSRNFPTQYWPYADNQFRMQNPYWIIDRINYQNVYTRLFLGANLKYDITDWMNIQSRIKLESHNNSSENTYDASSNTLFSGESGRFDRYRNERKQYYFDVLLNINKTFENKIAFVSNMGYTYTYNESQGLGLTSWIPLGAVPNLFNTGNSRGDANSWLPNRSNYQALFGTAEISYNQMFYLNTSLRSDWWSQLYGTGKLYIIYPSFGASVILTNIFNIDPDILSYAKIRANYTNVGNPPPAYIAGIQTYPVSNGSVNFGSGVKPSLTLQPEKTRGYEVGFNLKFWKNHFNLDVTLYDTDTYNQIFNVPISASSFYSSFYINAGQVNNKGIEAALGFNTDYNKFKWESNLTFSLNRNKVIKLIDHYYDKSSGQTITRTEIDKGGAGSYANKVRVGGSLADVYVTGLQLDKGFNDHYVAVAGGKVSVNDNDYIYAGQSTPNFNIGLRNSFTYGNFNLSFTINGRFGGIVVSATQAMMDAFGVSKTTADARDRGYVMVNGYPLPGVKDYYVTLGNGLNGVLANYVYSATNIRIRDLALSYSIPGKYFNNLIQRLTLSLTAQNVLMLYNKAPFDPESTASTGTYYQGFDYFMQPSLRSLGFNVRIQF